jgi:hypothetical protein
MPGSLLRCAGYASALLATGCSLVLDFSDRVDTSNTVSVEACQASEPNDSLGAAQDLAPGSYQLAVCPVGDRDYFSIDVGSNQDLTVVIEFDHRGGAGDLDLALFNLAGNMIDESARATDEERIERTNAMGTQLAAGVYVVEIFGFEDSIQNAYSLTLSGDAPPAADAGVDAMPAVAPPSPE